MIVKSLKIAVASSGLGHVARGVEACADYLARALHERGEDVVLFRGSGLPAAEYERVVLCLRRNDAAMRRFQGWLPRRAVWRIGLGSQYDIEQTTFAFRLIGQLNRERCDVLHVQDPLVALYVQRAWRMGLTRTRPILSHGTEEPAEFLRKVRYLLHLTPWNGDLVRQQGADRPTWSVAPNFVDTNRFQPGSGAAHGQTELRRKMGIPEQAVVVLCAASIKRHHKRIDYLLEEFATLRRTRGDLPVWLVVAGATTGDTDELVRRGREQLGDRVHFLLNYPLADMPGLYRAADVFALCSLREMLPMALLEAMATGVPCLVHDHPSHRWIIGQGGQAIDMSRSGALATQLASLAEQPAQLREMGQAARQHCLATFGQERVINQYLEYYRFVLADMPAARSRVEGAKASVTT